MLDIVTNVVFFSCYKKSLIKFVLHAFKHTPYNIIYRVFSEKSIFISSACVRNRKNSFIAKTTNTSSYIYRSLMWYKTVIALIKKKQLKHIIKQHD